MGSWPRLQFRCNYAYQCARSQVEFLFVKEQTRFCKFCFISWVHTGLQVLLKCIWSSLETNLCVNGSFFTWPILTNRTYISCNRNFKTSKCLSALSSKVKTRPWDCIYQIKASEVYYQSVNRLEPQISLSQASKRELIDEWGYWSPRNVGRFSSVPLHELVQKFHDFLFSLYLMAETTLMKDLVVEKKWPMFHNRAIFLFCGFLNAVYSFFQLVQATFSCPPAATSSDTLQDEWTSRQ